MVARDRAVPEAAALSGQLFFFVPDQQRGLAMTDGPWTIDLCGARTPREKVRSKGRVRLANMDRVRR